MMGELVFEMKKFFFDFHISLAFDADNAVGSRLGFGGKQFTQPVKEFSDRSRGSRWDGNWFGWFENNFKTGLAGLNLVGIAVLFGVAGSHELFD